MKQFPRLYSLSTIGLIHHQEFDYRFHPLRTDFIGDSGTGKSMISDLLQLIFVGSGAFESATKGTNERKPTGMVLSQSGRGANIGYAFLNVEMQANIYVCLGVYIESTNSQTEAFIIHSGYDPNVLEAFEKPLTTADLLKNDDILPLDMLKEHLEEKGLTCQSWQRIKSYHEILFNNKLLPLNLAENDRTLKDFAQIIQSFSRGKTLETNKSSSLKDFLFGDGEFQKILKYFKDAVKELESDIGAYGRNRLEIERVTQKQNAYVALKQKKDKKDTLHHIWLEKDFLYKQQEQAKLLQELKDAASHYLRASKFLERLKQWAVSESNAIKITAQGISTKLSESKKAHGDIMPEYNTLQRAQSLLSDLNCTPESLQEYYERDRALRDQNRIIKTVKDELISIGLLAYFEANNWPDAYKDFLATINNKINQYQTEIEVKVTLKGYANLTGKESLGYWAFHNNRVLTWEEESALVHFQHLPRFKPDNKERFLPLPNEFIQALAIAEKEPDGFWLNLKEVWEFIRYTPHRIFNTTDKAEIQKYFDGFSKELDIEIKERQLEIEKLSQLQLLFSKSDHPRKFYETIVQPDKDLPEVEIEALDVSPEEFQKYQASLANAKRIISQFKGAEDNYQYAVWNEQNIAAKQKSLSDIFKIVDYVEEESPAIDAILTEYGRREKEEYLEPTFNLDNVTSVFEKVRYHKNNFNSHRLMELSEKHAYALSRLEHAKKNYLEHYHDIQELAMDMEVLLEEPKIEREDYLQAETSYQDHYNHIIQSYLADDSHRFVGSYDFLELGINLLPEALLNQVTTEQDAIEKVQYYLNQINDKNRQLTSRKIQRLKAVVDEVDAVISEQLDIARRIDNFFTENEKVVTGGYQVRLTRELSQVYPKAWITTLKDSVENQMNLFAENLQTDLVGKLALEVSLEEVMKKAFYACGGSKDIKVDIAKLLNPSSYFELTFSMKSSTGRTNIGSTGQTYAAISLLCIARLSVIGRKELERQKNGIRFMPIDEAEGLGSNFDLLYKIAEDYDYQIVAMSVGSVGRFKEGSQYVYILHKNIDEEDPVNYTPMAIWNLDDLENE